jgi:hypothetical protein
MRVKESKEDFPSSSLGRCFFEKKKQKTFAPLRAVVGAARINS